MAKSLPRIANETTEVGWITSRRYVPYVVTSFAISLVLCWMFWFLLYAIPMYLLVSHVGGFSQTDASFLVTGLGIFLASVITPLYGILWVMDEVARVTTDLNKVRVFFGQRSWKKIVKMAGKGKDSA